MSIGPILFYNVRLRGGDYDGHTFQDLIAKIRIPHYRKTDQVDPDGYLIFEYSQGANLPMPKAWFVDL